MVKKIVTCLMIILFCFAIAGQYIGEQTYMAGKVQGKYDGKEDASFLWFLAGMGCNCLGVAAAYFIKGEVPPSHVVGRPAAYVRGYTDGYIKAKRWRQTMWAGLGWIINSTLLGSGYSASN